MGDKRTPLFRSTIRVGPVRKSEPAPAPRNRYETGGDLGQGGMGKVARGMDRFLGRPVAFKRSLDGDPQMLEALLHEAEIAARLDHPSIVTIHDVAHDENDEPFVVMRLVDGKSLGDVLEGADFDARLRLLPRLVSAVEAVAYAHTQGVVHRDLKPGNILVADRGDTVVIDWGLALDMRAARDPFEGSSVGTPGFIAPEQARGERADPRVDVYALGVTLRFLLAGELTEKLPPGVPADLVTIVDKACAADPPERYPSATELAADLDRFIGGQLVASHRYSVGQRLVRWIKQHRIPFAIATVAMTASITFGAISLYRVFDARAVAEHEREVARAAEKREAERVDQLLVDRAHAATTEDPARAIALLDLRAKPRLDAAARMVAIGALANLVPRAWRAHQTLITQLLPLGGDRFVSAAFDGTVLLHDGDRGSTKVEHTAASAMTLAPMTGGFVVKSDGKLERFDTRGAKLGEIAITQSYVDSRGDWYVAFDIGGEYVVARFDGAARYTFRGGVHDVTFDHGTKRVVLTGEIGAQLVELATGASRVLTKERARQGIFSPDDTRLMIVTEDQGVEEYDTATWQRIDEFKSESGVLFAYFGKQRTSIDHNGCVRLEHPGPQQKQLACSAHFTGAYNAADGWVAVGQDRELLLFAGDRMRRLGGAADTIQRIAVDPGGRYVMVGTRAGYVTIWDLEGGGIRSDRASAVAAFVQGDRLVVNEDSRLVAIEPDGTRTMIAELNMPGMGGALFELGGRIVAFQEGGPLLILHEGAMRPVVEGLARDAAKRNDREMLVLTLDDRLLWYDDPENHGARYVTNEDRIPATIGSDSTLGAMAVGFTDGMIWWRGRDDVDHQRDVGCKPSRVHPSATGVEVACGTALYTISASGEQRQVTQLPEPINDWKHVGDRWVILGRTGAVWRLDRGVLTKLLPESESLYVALANDRFATIERGSGVVWLHDLTAQSRIRLGQVQMPRTLQITPDGRSVLVVARGEVVRWQDPTPAGDVDWKTWRQTLTRATLSQPNAALQWP